jgi:hypothetical protein
MAFPGTFNISYYKGDTYEFNVYPKDSSGNPFDLTTYESAIFTLALTRGSAGAESQITGYAQISDDKTHVNCAITPQNAELIDDTKQYVYDVQIAKDASPYDLVYTILTGNITITKEVTLVTPDAQTPNSPENLSVDETPIGTVTLSWDAPESGPAPTSYRVYGRASSLGITSYVLLTTVSAPTTQYTANTILGFPLAPGIEYEVKVTSVTGSIENILEFAEISFISKTPSGSPENFVLAEEPAGTIAASWDAPSSGITPTGYNIYGKAPSLGVVEYVLLTPEPSPFTIFSASEFGGAPLILGVQYFIKVTSVNYDGENVTNFAEDSITLLQSKPEPEPEPTPEPEPEPTPEPEPEPTPEPEPEPTPEPEPEPTPEPEPEPEEPTQFSVTNSGSGAYIIDGQSNPTLTLVRGQTYVFDVNASGHPFWVQTSSGAYNSQNVLTTSDGIEGNGTSVGTITWTVSQSAPNTLYYVCQFHPAMQGTINIIDGE